MLGVSSTYRSYLLYFHLRTLALLVSSLGTSLERLMALDLAVGVRDIWCFGRSISVCKDGGMWMFGRIENWFRCAMK